MNPTLRMFLAVVCILVIAVCTVMITGKILGSARIDLTEYGLYTLSEGTRNVIAKVNQPVKLTLYYSRVAAMKGPEGIRYWNLRYVFVRDLLRQYVDLSGGKLRLEVVDPRTDSEEEDQAIECGVKKFPISKDENFFFGLVAETELGKRAVIEFFEPGREEFVEYDISKLIADATRREKKKVGVLSSLPVMGAANMSPYMMQMMRMQGRTPPQPWTIISQLREQYEVESVATDVRSIPGDIDFLMVIHPKGLSERTLFEIDQFVMKGGKLLVFVDPHCLADRPPPNPSNPYAGMQHKASSELNALLEGWGVKMDPGVVAADRRLAVMVRLRDRVEPLITYLNLNQECVNTEEVVTAKLHSVRMLFPGVVGRVPGTEATVVPLLSTTKRGNTWKPAGPFELQMPDPGAINRAVADGTEPLMLACRISGKLKTNFPDGFTLGSEDEDADKKDEDESKDSGKAEAKDKSGKADKQDAKDAKDKDAKKPRKLKAVQEASPDAMVLVFADVDMISDALAYQDTFFGMAQTGDNASVVLNALEFLSGGGDLIEIRSRGRFNRPFEVVDEIEAAAEKATADEKEAVRKKIQKFEASLRKLGSGADKKNRKLIHRKALAERRKLEEDIRKARKELRQLNKAKRDKIDSLKFWLQFHNMVWAPAVVLLIAVALGVVRVARARYYAARRK